MKLICINNIYLEKELTLGKIYDVQRKTAGYECRHIFSQDRYIDLMDLLAQGIDTAYVIVNDLGNPWAATKIGDRSRFLTLEEWREKQLNEIL